MDLEPDMNRLHRLSQWFWLALVLFFVWDWWYSPAVNLRLEPPLIAAGSGQSSDAGHCAMAGAMKK
ncbi:MAG: hypothetical protein RL111_1223 [Pseudomonadota bacterium]|jgi:hypothetical protein